MDTMNTRSTQRQVVVSNNSTPFVKTEDDNDSTDDLKNSKKGPKRKREQKSNPYAKQYIPGGDLHDYFFEAAPKWTVGGALRRLLTKVRHNPNSTISIHKFIKDSCKGNLKDYFSLVRNSMNRGDTMVMAEVAYKSFVQLVEGEKPLLRVIPPKHKPRSRAAAVSEEGYAFKDYSVQVTKYGFDLMNAKMVFDDFSEDAPPPRKKKQIAHNDNSSSNPKAVNVNNSNNTHVQPQLQSNHIPPTMTATGIPLPEQFVPNITEQEQEIANNMILYLKVHIDSLLSTIHHLRTENENLKKEKLERQQLNEYLRYESMVLKNQLRLSQQTADEGDSQALSQSSSMMLGVNLTADAFPSPGICTGDGFEPSAPTSDSTSPNIIGVGNITADATVNYLAINSFLPTDASYNMAPLVQINNVGAAPVPCTEEPPH